MRCDARSDKGDSIAVASWSGRGGDVMRRDAMHQRRGVMAWRRGVNDAIQPGQRDGAPGQQLHQGHGRRAGSAAASRASAPGQQLRPAAGRAGSGPGRADAGRIGSGQQGQRTRAAAPPGQQGQRCRIASRPAGPTHQGGSSTRQQGGPLRSFTGQRIGPRTVKGRHRADAGPDRQQAARAASFPGRTTHAQGRPAGPAAGSHASPSHAGT